MHKKIIALILGIVLTIPSLPSIIDAAMYRLYTPIGLQVQAVTLIPDILASALALIWMVIVTYVIWGGK